MADTMKDVYELEYEVISPTHIGTGEDIPKTELAYEVGNDFIRRVNFDKFIGTLPAHRIGSVSKFIRSARNDYLNNILEHEHIDLDEIAGDYDLKFYSNYNPKDIQKIRDISPFLKTPFLKPYIPGSTIKGWLRTAFLFYWLARIKESKRYLGDVDDKLDHLPRKGWRFYKEKLKMGKIIEKKLFGKNPQADIFKYMLCSDTNPIENSCLNLAFIQIFHPNKRRGDWNYERLGFSLNFEVLSEKTKFKGNIRFHTDLERYKMEYLTSNQLHHRLRDYIITHFFEVPKEERFQKLCEISNYFAKSIFQYNRKYLMALAEATESHYIQNIADFYNDTLFPTYDSLVESENQFLMRIGAGTEWHSKTIGLQVMTYLMDTLGYDFNRFYDRINRLKLFKGGRKHKHFELTPISRAYVVNRMNNPISPLGWIKVKLIE
jgi:CRISPR type III-A-associated RAMP protein Csm5